MDKIDKKSLVRTNTAKLREMGKFFKGKRINYPLGLFSIYAYMKRRNYDTDILKINTTLMP